MTVSIIDEGDSSSCLRRRSEVEVEVEAEVCGSSSERGQT